MSALEMAAIERRWKAIPDRVITAATKVMNDTLPLIVAEMKYVAPEQYGSLVASIGWTWGDAPEGSLSIGRVGGGKAFGGLRATIYAGDATTLVTNSRGIAFQNAKLQEFGTKAMPANPYFFPVWRRWRPRLRGRLTRAIKKAVLEG